MAKKKLPIVAIVGRANVGKSSLFNCVLKQKEAITAREPGTTRDPVWAKVSFSRKDFWLVDTAGVKDPEDEFELTIQDQIEDAMLSSDIICVVVEADVPVNQEDRHTAKKALKTKKPVFLVVNKADKVDSKDQNNRQDEYKKLGIKNILLTSATQNQGIEEFLSHLTKDLPDIAERQISDSISLAILGRPNVGKSSLYNTLIKKQGAIVHNRAGTTRDVNKSLIKYKGKALEISDTAGIRRSGRIERGVEKFSILRTISTIEDSDICLVLIDSQELNTKLDQKIVGMVKEAGKGLIIVISKWDLAKDSQDTKKPAGSSSLQDRISRRILAEFAFVPWAPLIFTSSVTGQNALKIYDLALEIFQNRHNRVSQDKLKIWLDQTLSKHPPAGLKNTNPRLTSIVQETDDPTNFKIYGRDARQLHWSYRRYLERKLREEFGFQGTPVRFWFFNDVK